MSFRPLFSCVFMWISWQIHFLVWKLDIWQQLSAALFISPFSCWSFFFQLSCFWPFWLILVVRLWSFWTVFLSCSSFDSRVFPLTDNVDFCSTFLLISKCIFLLFQPKMKSVLTFHLSFWAFPPVSFLDFEMRSLVSSVTLSCWVMLFLFVLSHPCRVESILLHFLPWATSISPFSVAWEELGEILKDKLVFSLAALSRGVCQVSIYRGVLCAAVHPYNNVRILCRRFVSTCSFNVIQKVCFNHFFIMLESLCWVFIQVHFLLGSCVDSLYFISM